MKKKRRGRVGKRGRIMAARRKEKRIGDTGKKIERKRKRKGWKRREKICQYLKKFLW